MNKMYELKNGDLTILLKGGNSDGKFEFEGLTVANKPNIIFKKYIWSRDNKEVDGKQLIEIGDYLFDKLKTEADKQLEEYIEQNINNQSFWTENNNEHYNFFTRTLSFKDECPQQRIDKDVSYYEIGEGIVTLIVNRILCVYDFNQDKFIRLTSEYSRADEKKDFTPLEVFYNKMELSQILAVEQYKRGVAHKTFTEIVNLNKWLEGKKSVKLNLKDGRVIEIKNNGEITARSIINIVENEFYINDYYYMKPRINATLPISELESLQFSRSTYLINIDNLSL